MATLPCPSNCETTVPIAQIRSGKPLLLFIFVAILAYGGRRMATDVAMPRLRMVNGVRARRRAMGWTQEQLALRAGIYPLSVRNVEAGRGSRDDIKCRLAEAFGCTVGDLFWSEPTCRCA